MHIITYLVRVSFVLLNILTKGSRLVFQVVSTATSFVNQAAFVFDETWLMDDLQYFCMNISKAIFFPENIMEHIQSFRLPHWNFKLKCRSCPGSKCLQIMQKSCHFSAFFNPVAKKWRNRSFQHLCILPLFTHVQKKLVLQKIYGNSLLSGIWSKIHEKLLFYMHQILSGNLF